MNGRPLGMAEAWDTYDRLFADERVTFHPEPAGAETRFREYAFGKLPSPKLWADGWLLAVAEAADGTLITFDRSLIAHGAHCLLPTT
jgi:hypothetical protein